MTDSQVMTRSGRQEGKNLASVLRKVAYQVSKQASVPASLECSEYHTFLTFALEDGTCVSLNMHQISGEKGGEV